MHPFRCSIKAVDCQVIIGMIVTECWLLQNMGLDVEKILLCQPDNGEMALEVVDQLVRSNAVDIIAIDSVAALVPRAEIEGEIGAVQGEVHHLRCCLDCDAHFIVARIARNCGRLILMAVFVILQLERRLD